MKKTGIGLVIIGLVVAMQSQAALLVDYTKAQVGSSLFIGSPFSLDTNTAMIANGYSGDYTGPSIYGGFEEIVGTSAAISVNSGAGARIRWGSGAIGESAVSVFLFRKDEFLNGMDTGIVSMDAANDTVTADFAFPGNDGDPTVNMRLVLLDDAGWHISAASSMWAGDQTLEATELNYFSYNPLSDMTSIGATIDTTVSFNDIQFVGYYIDAVLTTASTGSNAGLEDFSIQAIPEPATLGLVSAFGAGILFMRRRLMM